MSALFTADWRREPGVHSFSGVDGTPITAVSANTWEEFHDTLASINASSGYVLSPELMTTPFSLSEIPERIDEAHDRVKEVEYLSSSNPEATILLGGPSLDDNNHLRNSLHVIRNGQTVGAIDKRGVTFEEEAKTFSRQPRQQATLNLGYAAVICSDVVATYMARPESDRRRHQLPDSVHTLLVSATWAVPRFKGIYVDPRPDEERFRGHLETAISKLFSRYPHLLEVIVSDRTPHGGTTQPLNGQFRRSSDELLN